jgi:signal transduction histidine kinase
VEALNSLLDEKAAALQQADRSKDEFLAILSHELRGPLSAAGMAARLLQAPDVSPARATQMGELIGRQVVHMSTLVEDLLDVSRVSRGLVEIARAPVDLADVVAAALEQVAPAAQLKGHTLVQTLPAEAVMVLGDKVRLVQVLGNLLSNSIRYTQDQGDIAVALERQGNWAVLTVRDNGAGIDLALIPRLFDLYVQAERSTSRTGGGLGLGLALVKNLVEAHDGTVIASSEGTGQGSVFTVHLPLHQERRLA